MDKATLLGIVAGVLLLGWATLSGGSLSAFVDARALAITLGGTMAALLISTPLSRIRTLLPLLRAVLMGKEQNVHAWIEELVRMTAVARQEGLLALEEEAELLGDPFFQKGMMLAVDGTDPTKVRDLMELEIAALEERHRLGAQMFDLMARLAPAFGLVGTLIGLIRMLGQMENPRAVGPGMAVALVATLYGVLLANLLFAPISAKLKARSGEEVRAKEVILEGILAIQGGETPGMVKDRLQSFLSLRDRQEVHWQGEN